MLATYCCDGDSCPAGGQFRGSPEIAARALDRSKAQGAQALFILFWVYPEQTGLPSAPRSSPVVAWWAKRTRAKTAYLSAWSSYAPLFALEWISRNCGIRNFVLSGA